MVEDIVRDAGIGHVAIPLGLRVAFEEGHSDCGLGAADPFTAHHTISLQSFTNCTTCGDKPCLADAMNHWTKATRMAVGMFSSPEGRNIRQAT